MKYFIQIGTTLRTNSGWGTWPGTYVDCECPFHDVGNTNGRDQCLYLVLSMVVTRRSLVCQFHAVVLPYDAHNVPVFRPHENKPPVLAILHH